MNIFRQKRRLITQQLAHQSNLNNDSLEVSQSLRNKDASRNAVTRMLLLISMFSILTTLPFTFYKCLRFKIDASSLRAYTKRHL
ncbi:hypothetical protein DPMN_156339 [Dreissena polymorpha]|uniref:Uncharacterized protein n=1 Tax=Dreissena polymorpha TaxID=45954 RepID=A0A9D4FTE4_DREPO|nr:hypothetical protein DPMN_156339 [Dreissena polymorpha]